MDAFVFPSRTDTFGLVILEAMASGVPVLVIPETGARVGIRDDVEGFLGDSFAAGVRKLMEAEPLRLQMGQAARELAASQDFGIPLSRRLQDLRGGSADRCRARPADQAAAD